MEHENLEIMKEAARLIPSTYLPFSWTALLVWGASNSNQREIAWKQVGYQLKKKTTKQNQQVLKALWQCLEPSSMCYPGFSAQWWHLEVWLPDWVTSEGWGNHMLLVSLPYLAASFPDCRSLQAQVWQLCQETSCWPVSSGVDDCWVRTHPPAAGWEWGGSRV